MICAGTATIDLSDQWVLLRCAVASEMVKDAFGHGRAADVAQADEENGDGAARRLLAIDFCRHGRVVDILTRGTPALRDCVLLSRVRG